jgi:hypothetical protein
MDEVRYRPQGGTLMNWLFVRRDLERIFAFRSERLAQILCQKSTIIAQGAPGADALDR